MINGVASNEARKLTMEADDEVLMITPGGGGFWQARLSFGAMYE